MRTNERRPERRLKAAKSFAGDGTNVAAATDSPVDLWADAATSTVGWDFKPDCAVLRIATSGRVFRFRFVIAGGEG